MLVFRPIKGIAHPNTRIQWYYKLLQVPSVDYESDNISIIAFPRPVLD